MSESTLYMCLYSANFAFILTNIYGWLIKAFYKPEPYRDNFDNLFPAQGAVAALYLMQLFEIPYLLMVGQPKALFYINSFSILLFPSLMVVMSEGYFFLKVKKGLQLAGFFMPVAIIVAYLLLAAVEIVPATRGTYQVIFLIVTALFFYYVLRLIIIRDKINRSVRAVIHGRYSNCNDFPILFAQRVEWLPFGICVTMYACFLLNDPQIKMWRDVLYTFVNVWFLLYTQNPHRAGIIQDEDSEQELKRILTEAESNSKYKLTAERCTTIDINLTELIEREKIFLDSHLTLDNIAQRLGVNRNYLSEAISRGKHGSFYAMINFYRLQYAESMMRRDHTLKIEYIAMDSGFSSVSLFSQLFKRHYGVPPSLFVKRLQRGK